MVLPLTVCSHYLKKLLNNDDCGYSYVFVMPWIGSEMLPKPSLFIYRQKIRTIRQARNLIDQYIHFYNFERIQTKSGHTPFQIRSMAV